MAEQIFPSPTIPVTSATLLAGEDLVANRLITEDRNTYTHTSTAVTTVVKTGSGFLKSITVNTTAAGTITVYDNTAGSGTVIAILKASIVENTYEFNVAFATGLTVVTAGASDITIGFR